MRYFYLLFSFILISLFSCKEKHKTISSQEAEELFNNSAELIINVTSQINQACDSAAVDSLYAVYEKKITDINFSVPPETDLKLTEQENDSLFRLQQRLNLIVKMRLEMFHKTYADTIPEN